MPRPLALANPLPRVPRPAPLPVPPRPGTPTLPRDGPPMALDGGAGVENLAVDLEDVGGLSTNEVSVVLRSKNIVISTAN
jgi:hypothetical protein